VEAAARNVAATRDAVGVLLAEAAVVAVAGQHVEGQLAVLGHDQDYPPGLLLLGLGLGLDLGLVCCQAASQPGSLSLTSPQKKAPSLLLLDSLSRQSSLAAASSFSDSESLVWAWGLRERKMAAELDTCWASKSAARRALE
jgi:hypothetical protein